MSLEKAIKADSLLQHYINNKEYKIQFLISEIRNGCVKTIAKHTSPYEYFYPASTVKMPFAILAMELLNEHHISLDSELTNTYKETILPTCDDPQNNICSQKIEEMFARLFVLSDNTAYNRMFEFVTPNRANARLSEVNIGATRLVHQVGNSALVLIDSFPKIEIYQNDKLLYKKNTDIYDFIDTKLKLNNERQGVGYIDKDGTLINEPFDFSSKNYISLESLHQILLRLIIPTSYPLSQRFKITEDQRKYLLGIMETLPREYAKFKDMSLPDNYCKFLAFGKQPKISSTERYTVANKIGLAYGYTTDIACFTDKITGDKLVVSTTILTNRNGIFNDGIYEYENEAFLFMHAFGKKILEWHSNKSSIYLDL